MATNRDNPPITSAEAKALFAELQAAPAIVLAVSGGPDSTALLWLAANWRAKLKRGPKLLAVTVDHGLRAESAREARDVKVLAASLRVDHRTLKWTGPKPKAGLPAAARDARYGLLARAAKAAKATHIVTAHTSDDQAETLLMRLARGSGVAGLAAMARQSPRGDLVLARPLLDVPKARLVATLEKAGVGFVTDPTNHDLAFTRPRLRALMPALADEGIDARSLTRFAARVARANAALEQIADIVARSIVRAAGPGAIEFDARAFATLPDEVALRLLARAVGSVATEGQPQLAKLEALLAAIRVKGAGRRSRQTLAGALISASDDLIVIGRAPPRRSRA
ncbi:MAG: tRNA lysidine(34) synthetase TilS [Pseudomonadota bacterium]